MPPTQALEGQGEEEEEAAAAQVPGDRARCRPLSELPGGRGSAPWGRPRCPPAGGSGKAVGAVGPGQAWAGSGLLGWPGPLPSLGGEWDQAGAPHGSWVGVIASFWGPLQTGLSTYYVPGTVVGAAGPSEQGHKVQAGA